MTAIGLDLGTTKLCALALDGATGRVLKTLHTASPVLPGRPFESLQDAGAIGDAAAQMVAALEAEFAPVCAVGISGAMHGVLYLSENGAPLGPLHTWQDQTAAQPVPGAGGETYCSQLEKRTGTPVPAGYGLATLYAHLHMGTVPAGAAALATIGDYAALRLTGAKKPALHPTMAASLGLFNVAEGRFDDAALEKAGLPEMAALLPALSGQNAPIGQTPAGTPVYPAVGDSQAAFAGAVQSAGDSLLVNIGTGSQLALVGDDPAGLPGLETRPFFGGQYLYTGAALCGGSAWALLEKFYRAVLAMAGCPAQGRLYDQMEAQLEKGLPPGPPLAVDTTFLGTRQDPTHRGAVTGISPQNFTPAHLTAGLLAGMAGELHRMVQAAGPAARRGTLVAAGGAVRKTPALARALHQAFGLPPRRPAQAEEAARGAAIATLAATGRYQGLEAAMAALNHYE